VTVQCFLNADNSSPIRTNAMLLADKLVNFSRQVFDVTRTIFSANFSSARDSKMYDSSGDEALGTIAVVRFQKEKSNNVGVTTDIAEVVEIQIHPIPPFSNAFT